MNILVLFLKPVVGGVELDDKKFASSSCLLTLFLLE